MTPREARYALDRAVAVAGPATPETEKARIFDRQQEDRTRQIVIEELHRQLGGQRVSQSHGCVCPVGAEKTCAGPLCPRKPIGSPA